MPRIAEVFGIVISMYHEEHGVPHFHAYYGVSTAPSSAVIPSGSSVAGYRTGRDVWS